MDGMVGSQGRSNNFYDGASAHNDRLGAMAATNSMDGAPDTVGSGSNVKGIASNGTGN